MFNFDNLVFEITRKCNMKCRHCLRGNAQNKTMSKEVMRKVLQKTSYINSVTFGGGEPTLALDMIWYFIECCRMYDVTVGNFYIVTNGKVYRRELEDVCDALYLLCCENEISGLTVSDDEFHREYQPNRRLFEKTKLRYMYGESIYNEEIKNYGELSDLAKPYARFNDKYHKDYEFYGIINMGRAKENGLGHRELLPDTPEVYKDNQNNYIVNDCVVYIAYDGNIISTCDCSYDEMDKFKIGTIDDIDNAFSKFINDELNQAS